MAAKKANTLLFCISRSINPGSQREIVLFCTYHTSLGKQGSRLRLVIKNVLLIVSCLALEQPALGSCRLSIIGDFLAEVRCASVMDAVVN